jgi:ubiquinone/menaquinone biosynthesis C-methylase UbiE
MIEKIPLKIRLAIPKRIHNLFFLFLDSFEVMIKRREWNIPPKHLNLVGGKNPKNLDYQTYFKKVGKHFLKLFKKLGHLEPSNNVLDIGCGIGRMARPLTTFLNPDAYYCGFDINKEVIDWVQKHITSYYPNFHFKYIDIKNPLYNVKGSQESNKFRFPYKNAVFDFIFLTSIFTHFQEEEMSKYLDEIYRVLRPDGTVFITLFLINPESRMQMQKGLCVYKFRRITKVMWSLGTAIAEHGIAYEESFIKTLIDEKGFKIVNIFYGNWVQREEFTSLQDIVILKKKEWENENWLELKPISASFA